MEADSHTAVAVVAAEGSPVDRVEELAVVAVVVAAVVGHTFAAGVVACGRSQC